MTNKPQTKKIIILLSILIGIFFYYILKDYRLVEKERYSGFSSEIRQSRYEVLKGYLERMEFTVEKHVRITSIKDLKNNNGVVFIGVLPNRYTEDEYNKIIEWVKDGGHLIINAPESYNPESYNDADTGGYGTEDKNTLLKHFGILREYDDSSEDDEITKISLDNFVYTVSYHTHTKLSYITELNIISSEEDRDRFIQMEFGDGTVSIFGDNSFLLNDMIIDNDNALFAFELFNFRNQTGKIWIVEQPRMPYFMELIWDYYRNVVISIGVFLLMFLFWAGRRFGSIIEIEDTTRRSLLEQIHAAGIFAFKTKSLQKLIDRVRKDLIFRIEAKHPSIVFDSQHDIYDDIALITSLDKTLVEYAFTHIINNQQIEFLKIIRALYKIGKRI